MLTSVFTSVLAYISTNIDDIFVIMLLLAQAKRAAKAKLIAGHILGVTLLTAISMLGAFGLQQLSLRYVGLLGLVPIGLGIKAWLDRDDEEKAFKQVGFLTMALITLGNGADNLGVYIPLFSGFSATEQIVAALIFAMMTALWIWLANALANLPKIKAFLAKYKHFVVPIVLIFLGVCILLESYT